ncbi:MAG: NADH-quinone oxidoreductase subunit D [Bacteroidales bacterium]|nr:NADH-quinone oxidoreductase subunit D [Bacteroidales bacterium]MCF8458220.1 NADH-quinone oxidoreductase subunit D [Bacteroidales bacterium]
MMKNSIFNISPDRSKYPEKDAEGNLMVDLDSQKYVKLWQGPQHPGVTGNMSLELTISGDEIIQAKTHVGYLHRGFEKLMERRKYIQCFPTCIRMCVAEPDYNEYNLAAGIEELSGIEVPEMAQWLRTLVLEMARLQSLLRVVPGQGGTFALGLGVQWGVYLRDLILDLFEELTGGRVYHMYILPGGVRGLLPDGFKKRMEETLKKIDEFVVNIDNLMFSNAVFKQRAKDVGIIQPEWIDQFGIVGPNARSAGFMRDVRKDYPYLVYDQLDFEPMTMNYSDIYNRARLRWHDLIMTVDLIRQIMAKIPETGDIKAPTPNVLHWKIPRNETYIRSESSRGEYGFYMVSDGTDKPRRINLRGPSYVHAISLLEHMLINANIADTAAIMVSLQTCPPEIER